MADALTGRTARKSFRLAARQADEQRARLDEEERKTSAVEAGQRRLRGGGRGFLSYIEESGLGSTLGRSSSAASSTRDLMG